MQPLTDSDTTAPVSDWTEALPILRALDSLAPRKHWVTVHPDKATAMLCLAMDMQWRTAEDLVDRFTEDCQELLVENTPPTE